MSSNRDEIIRKLYNIYRFIEKDVSKFMEIPCLNDVKDLSDGAKKINYYIAQKINEDGFIATFKSAAQTSGIDKALIIFNLVSELTGYEITEEDIIAIANIEEYKEDYDAFIKYYFIKNENDLDNRGISNALQKKVLLARLNSEEVKKYRKKESEEKRRKHIKPIYQDIPFSKEEIDRVILTLSPEERELLERRERGEKLSKEENDKTYRIKNKVTNILKKQNKKEENPTVSNEVIEEKQPQQEPPVDNNPSPIEEQRPVFSNVIEKIQSIQKLDNIVTGKEEQKNNIEEMRVNENMSNENKYNIVVYKRVNADHSLIDKAILELPEKDQKLIERKGRISLGIFDKLLTSVEEEEFDSIIKKIIHIVDPKAEIVEPKEEKKTPVKAAKPKKEKKEKSKTAKKRGKKPVSIYKLIPADKHLVEKYLNEKLDAEKLEIVNKREKLIREGRYDEIPKSYKSIIQGIVIPARKRIMFLEEEINKLQKRKESKQKNKKGGRRKELQEFFPSYSKEELAKLIEKLSDDDREIIQARSEGKELTKSDLGRYYRVIYDLQKGIIPAPRNRIEKTELPIIETQEGKGVHPELSIFTLIPVDEESLIIHMENNLDEEEKNIVKIRERIVYSKSSERITQRAADKFARIVKKIKEELIPEEDREEAYKKTRKEARTSFYESEGMKSFDREEIDTEIECLSDEEKELIEKAENGEKLTIQERGKIRYIASKIVKKLYQKKIKVEKTPISREQLVEELKQKKITANSTYEKQEDPQGIKQKEIDDDERIMADYFKGLLVAATKSAKVAERVGAINLAMISLRYGTVEGVPKRTSEEIAKFLEMDSETVEKTITNTLKEIYDVIVESLVNNNTNSFKSLVKTDGETREE